MGAYALLGASRNRAALALCLALATLAGCAGSDHPPVGDPGVGTGTPNWTPEGGTVARDSTADTPARQGEDSASDVAVTQPGQDAAQPGEDAQNSTASDVPIANDVIAQLDVSTPIDAVTGTDVSAPIDAATPTDAATPADVVVPCPAGTTRCGAACVALSTDPLHCGSCERVCAAGALCSGGACVSVPTQPWLSEYRDYAPAGVELHNPSAAPIQLAGYRLHVDGPETLDVALHARVLAPGEFVFLTGTSGDDDATKMYLGASAAFGASAAVTLYDPTGTPVDFVRVGACTVPPPAGARWVGGNAPDPGDETDTSVRRNLAAPDTDTMADWVVAMPSTPGFDCYPGLAACNGACVDLASNPYRCGACGTRCAASETCTSGRCVSVGAVVLSEIHNGAVRTIELFNGTRAAVDLSGWVLEWTADGGAGRYVVRAGVVVAAGGFLLLDERAGASTADTVSMGAAIPWVNWIAVALRDATGADVDFVRTGDATMMPASGAGWTSGSAGNASQSAAQSVERAVYTPDTNGPADWRVVPVSTPLAYCAAGQTVCGGRCVDTHRDASNCGACGNACAGGDPCRNAVCDGPFGEGDVRVAGVTGSVGRLEVLHAGVWGSVCSDSFGDTDAAVACRQMGFAGGQALTFYGGGAGVIWLDDVVCSGSEARLVDCAHQVFGINNCSHLDDVGVRCVP